jgi:hypothetical protein
MLVKISVTDQDDFYPSDFSNRLGTDPDPIHIKFVHFSNKKLLAQKGL